jgi:Putative Actinobacterial Holin-X, holin superfamily III
MVRSETPEPVDADQSLGDLVALAAKDVSQLVRYEIDLAKTELRADLQRIGLAGAMGGFSFYVGTVVFVLLCFAYAYGLIAAGIWAWAAFLIVAGTCLVLAALVAGIAYLKVKKLSGLRLTKKTVTEDLAMLRREDQQPPISPDGDRPAISRDGQRAGIAARETK